MKKRSQGPDPEMREEYDFRGGVRGKYADRVAEGSNVVILDPDVAETFSDSVSVNRALRGLARSDRRKQKDASRK